MEEHKEILGGNGTVLHPDFGGGYSKLYLC